MNAKFHIVLVHAASTLALPCLVQRFPVYDYRQLQIASFKYQKNKELNGGIRKLTRNILGHKTGGSYTLTSCQSDFCSISDMSESSTSAMNTDKTLQSLLTEMANNQMK